MNLMTESVVLQDAIETRAAQLVRDGVALPWDAIVLARDQIMRERRQRSLTQRWPFDRTDFMTIRWR
jgi:hypothetical protein